MGLTIHYKLRFDGTKQELVDALQGIKKRCLDMPFEEVGIVEQKEITKEVIDTWNFYQDDPGYLPEQRDAAIGKLGFGPMDIITAMYYEKKPKLQPSSIVLLKLWPGEGCEDSNLCFNKSAKQKYWRCEAFCKTQYAEHFLRCHLLIIDLFDIIKEIKGFTIEIKDEGQYWETRDIEILAKEINVSTARLKAFSGILPKIMPGYEIECEIDKSQNIVKVSKDKPPTEN